MSRNVEKSLLDIDFASLTRRTVHPVAGRLGRPGAVLPAAGPLLRRQRERRLPRTSTAARWTTGATPLYRPEDPGRVDYDTWFRAGGGWQGGTLKGLRSKLGYLRRLGVTALWVSPPFRQVAFEPSYHGYGIQNFLDVDPHFGTREEFRDFVQAAHEQGIYVILDIIAHHTGNVFTYDPDRYPTHDPATGRWYNDPRWDGKPYAVPGFNDRDGRPTLPFGSPTRCRRRRRRLEASWPDGAIWPREFQRARAVPPQGAHHQLGLLPRVRRGGHVRPEDAGPPGSVGRAVPPAVVGPAWPGPRLLLLDRLRRPRRLPHRRRQAHGRRVRCGPSATSIREFAQSIGKENFLLVGEIGGSREHAWEVVERTGLDAALGIEDVPGKLERMVTGDADPADYFSLFRNWVLEEPAGHRWYRNQVVTLVDDHDQVRKGRRQVALLRRQPVPRPGVQRDGRAADHDGHPLHLLRLGAGLRQRRAAQRLGPGAPREHVRRPVRRAVHAGPALLQRGRRPVPRPGRARSTLRKQAAAAAARLGRCCTASPGTASHFGLPHRLRRADALARVLVASLGRPGSPGRPEHRRVEQPSRRGRRSRRRSASRAISST